VTAAAVLARNSRAAHGPTTPPRKFSGFHYEKGSSRGANLFSPNSFPPIGLQHLAQSASGRRCVFHHSAHTWRLPSRARHSPFRACWFGLRAEPWRFLLRPDVDGLELSLSPVSTPVWLTGCASRRPDVYVFESRGVYNRLERLRPFRDQTTRLPPGGGRRGWTPQRICTWQHHGCDLRCLSSRSSGGKCRSFGPPAAVDRGWVQPLADALFTSTVGCGGARTISYSSAATGHRQHLKPTDPPEKGAARRNRLRRSTALSRRQSRRRATPRVVRINEPDLARFDLKLGPHRSQILVQAPLWLGL